MSKKISAIVAVAAMAFAVAFVASGDAAACDGKTKTASAKSSCSKSATTTASSGCSKSTATTASAGCNKSATTTASAGCCKASGKAAVAGYTKKASASCSKSAGATASAACCKAEKAAAKIAALRGIVDELPYRESKRLVVTGSVACGKCSYHLTESCAPLLKTTDGKVYPLIKSDFVKQMRNSSAAEFKVSSRVRKMGGLSYLDIQAIEAN